MKHEDELKKKGPAETEKEVADEELEKPEFSRRLLPKIQLRHRILPPVS